MAMMQGEVGDAGRRGTQDRELRPGGSGARGSF